jgi:uncharacterized membrane protein
LTPARRIALVVLGVAMVAIGVDHFANPEPFTRIVPAWLPAPRALVLVSGAFEVLGGIGVLVPATRRLAAWGLIALFVAVFPANVNMALHHIQLTADGTLPVWAMWARLPLQLVLIAWAHSYARADAAASK